MKHPSLLESSKGDNWKRFNSHQRQTQIKMLKYQIVRSTPNSSQVDRASIASRINKSRRKSATQLSRLFDAAGSHSNPNGPKDSCCGTPSCESSRNSLTSSECSSQQSSVVTPEATAGKPKQQLLVNIKNGPARNRSMSISSLSSSSSDSGFEWGTIRVYTSSLRNDSDYKTLFISSAHSAGEVTQMVLEKLIKGRTPNNFSERPPKIRDPNLFYIAMELQTNHNGTVVRSLIALEHTAKPLLLQSCHPRDKARFILQGRTGMPIRIYDSSLHPAFNYKCLLISQRTTALQVIDMLLATYHLYDSSDAYNIVIFDTSSRAEYSLMSSDVVAFVLDQLRFESGRHQLHIKPQLRSRNVITIPIAYSTIASKSLTEFYPSTEVSDV